MNLTKLCRKYQLEPGDVVGVTDFGPVSIALRHRTAGPTEGILHARVATHVAMVVGCRQGSGLDLVEATPPRVRHSQETNIHGRVIFVWRPIGLDVERAILYLHEQEGTPYDLPAFAALYGLGRQDLHMKYCSELVYGALVAGRYPAVHAPWKICVTPWDMQLFAHATREIIYSSERPWW